MSLFSNPVTMNDGTSDHIMSFRGQMPDPTSMVGEWIEDAATLAEASKVTIKHDLRSTSTKRHLLSRTVNKLIADGVTYKGITINVTAIHHGEHTATQIGEEVANVKDLLGEANFASFFAKGYI